MNNENIKETADYKKIDRIPSIDSLDEVFELLNEYYKSGEDVCYDFAGTLFFSDKCDNIDYVYETSLGVTKKEYNEELNHFLSSRQLNEQIPKNDLQEAKDILSDIEDASSMAKKDFDNGIIYTNNNIELR